MSEEFVPQMEGDILQEETKEKEEKAAGKIEVKDISKPKRPPFNLKKFIQNLKAPKPIFMIILMILLIVSYTGLIMLAVERIKPSLVQRKSDDVIIDEGIEEASPDPELELMKEKVVDYKREIEYVNENNRKYQPPNIDLDINFQPD